jgi:hypothetical protein
MPKEILVWKLKKFTSSFGFLITTRHKEWKASLTAFLSCAAARFLE